MPAPTPAQIQASLTTAFLAAGFVKKIVHNGAFVDVPGTLPDNLVKMIQAIANGDNNFWNTWQLAQGVTLVTGAGVPGTGVLLP